MSLSKRCFLYNADPDCCNTAVVRFDVRTKESDGLKPNPKREALAVATDEVGLAHAGDDHRTER